MAEIPIHQQETKKSFSVREKIKGFFEYRKAKRKMQQVLTTVRSEKELKMHRENGEQKTKLELTAPLSVRNTIELYDELGSQFRGYPVRIEDKSAWKAVPEHITPGWLEVNVLFPIVQIPEVAFNRQGMSPAQLARLEEESIKILDAASVPINVQTRSLMPDEQIRNHGQNFLIRVRPKEGFDGQEMATEAVTAAILHTPVMRERYQPNHAA